MTGKAGTIRPVRAAAGCTFLLAVALALAGCTTNEPAGTGIDDTPAGQMGAAKPGEAEQWLIPSSQPGLSMHARVLRPAGAGPFPLAIINHGSDQDARRRSASPPAGYPALERWFVEHGYVVVLPVRPGHPPTGGRYLENQGGCANADFRAMGDGVSASIEATIRYMARQPFIRPDGIVVVGHSAGGWGGLALAARNPAGIRAVINFAGGGGGRNFGKANDNCAPERLIASAAAFGRTARVPTLWLYAKNDTFFPPDLSQAMADAYRQAGGAVDYRLLPAQAGEGHMLIRSDAWREPLADFLKPGR